MPYLNVDEVESALGVATSAPFTSFTQLITLPNATWEGRQCHAVKIANGSGPGRPAVCFIGGLHAREWGSSDILVNFIEQVEQAYQTNSGITLGGKSFTAADIRSIVDNLDVVVFPQANPDGRNYSMTVDADWRKNRRTTAPNSSSGNCVGVDLNRNFDFVWDFQTQFASNAPVVVSADPCDKYLYHGPNAFSEPETQNCRWLLDQHPNVGWYVDLHSFSEDILYNWGDDDDQTTDPTMNFQNAAYNSVRGLADSLGDPNSGAYRDFIPPADKAFAVNLANAFQSGIQAVRGTSYTVKQSVNLYPTAGTSQDYAYSRHFVDGSKGNILSFTLEWGVEFQPVYSEMQNIIQEITSGLIEFCLFIRKSLEDCIVTTDRNTFGMDEVAALLTLSTPATVDAAFQVAIDGFRAADLNVHASDLTGTPAVSPNISFNPPLSSDIQVQATACSTDGNVIVDGPQRFTWTYQFIFRGTSDFTAEVRDIVMTASMTAATGEMVSGDALIVLTLQPNPYEIDGPTSWLSVDLQVFQLLQNGSLPSTPGITLNSGPNNFITQLVTTYNDPTLPRAPNHPFDHDLVANEDTSSVEIAGTVGGTPVFNFAVARVRYRALTTPAANVRVFFRMFQAATTSTDFQPATTYATGGMGGSKVPLLGVVNGEVVTIPFFAAARIDPTNPNGLNAQPDPTNVGPLGNPIPPDGSGNEVQVYFGCWLDINQNVPVLPASPASAAGPYTPVQSIQQAIANKHQCLVAEINLDPPEPQIVTGATPATSDKLAQRNLNVVGVASPHLVPVTFDIKPTAAPLPPGRTPDELMIDWRNAPARSNATVYLPALSAASIIATADRLYTNHGLTAVDAHTIGCRAAGISYIPIPPGIGSNYAGLLTVDVPSSVRPRETFDVVVRQLTYAAGERPAPPPPPPQIAIRAAFAARNDFIEWRRVLGSFQLTIPVSTREVLLPAEERLLSVLRWIGLSMPHDSRWYPVFQRYLDVIAGRVNALGGNASEIPPTSSGDWKVGKRCRVRATIFAMILGLLLGAFGALAGSTLAVAAALLAVLLVIVAVLWFSTCHPKPLQWLRALVGGAAFGAAILAVVWLLGVMTPQLLPLLAALVIAVAIGIILEWLL